MSNTVVVDASFAIKWVLSETDSSTAIMLLNRWISEGKELVAPALFTYEVTNIIYRRVVRDFLGYEEAVRALTDLLSMEISLNLSGSADISMQAMALAQR